MKRTIISLIIAAGVLTLAAVAPAWADATCPGVGNDCTQNNASASASATGGTHVQNSTQVNTQVNTQVTSQGQQQTYEGQQSTSVEVRTDVPRQAPPAVPAALSVSSLTCYGSWSIAASTPFGGVGAGFPTKDADCERSRNAMILVNLGLRDAALALLAQNEDTARALKAAKVSYPVEAAAAPAAKPAGEPAKEEKSEGTNFGTRASLPAPQS